MINKQYYIIYDVNTDEYFPGSNQNGSDYTYYGDSGDAYLETNNPKAVSSTPTDLDCIFYGYSISSGSGIADISAITESWDETTLTYNNTPSSSSVLDESTASANDNAFISLDITNTWSSIITEE